MDEYRVWEDWLSLSTIDAYLTEPYAGAPTPAFTWSCVDWDCTYDSSGSTGRGTLTCEWDFTNDGTYDVSGACGANSAGYSGWANRGPHTTKLRVTDDDGSATITHDVWLTHTTFSYTCTDHGSGLECTFDAAPATAAPGGLVTNPYEWEWGDGSANTISSTDVVSHTYSDYGPYTATLTVTAEGGTYGASVGTYTDDVTMAKADYTYTCTDRTCQYLDASTGSGTLTRAWDFTNDGTTDSTATSPSHTFAGSTLTHTTKLTVSNDAGDTDSTSKSVYMSDASFTYSCTDNGDGTYTCDFDASASATGDPGGIDRYEWTPGDGSGITNTATPSLTHTYTGTGPFTAGLTVWSNNDDTKALTSETVSMAGASFTWSCEEDACAFDGTSSTASGTITSYSWDLDGDGTQDATTATTTFTYSPAYGDGPWDVSLTVTDDTGATDTETQSVGIVVADFATVTLNPDLAVWEHDPNCLDDTCQFNATGLVTGYATRASRAATYAWAFGDTTSGTGEGPTHTYAGAGPWSVTLTVTTSDGSDNITRLAYTTYANFTTSCQANLCTFDATNSGTSGGALTYAWTFGDGATETTDSSITTHRYWTLGPHSPSLTVTNTTATGEDSTASFEHSLTMEVPAEGSVTGFSGIRAMAGDMNTDAPHLWLRDQGANRAYRYSTDLTRQASAEMCRVKTDLTAEEETGGLAVSSDNGGGLPAWACYTTRSDPDLYGIFDALLSGWARADLAGAEADWHPIQPDQVLRDSGAYTLNRVAFIQAAQLNSRDTTVGAMDATDGTAIWTESAPGAEALAVDRALDAPTPRRVCATGDINAPTNSGTPLGIRCYALDTGVEQQRTSWGGDSIATWGGTVWVADGSEIRALDQTLSVTATQAATDVDTVAVSLDGKWLAGVGQGASNGAAVRLYWASNLTPAAEATVNDLDATPNHVAWSADNHHLFVANETTLWRFDVDGWTEPITGDIGANTDLGSATDQDPSTTSPRNGLGIDIQSVARALQTNTQAAGWFVTALLSFLLAVGLLSHTRMPAMGYFGAFAGMGVGFAFEWVPVWVPVVAAILGLAFAARRGVI